MAFSLCGMEVGSGEKRGDGKFWGGIGYVDGGFPRIFLVYPYLGMMIQSLRIFFKWVGSTTN